VTNCDSKHRKDASADGCAIASCHSPPVTTGALGDKKRVELHAGIIIRLILPFVALHCTGTVLLCHPGMYD